MIEFDPSKNLEMSQEALGDAWHAVAEALVLHSDAAIVPLTHELPPKSGGGHPYQFSVQLPSSFAKEVLLEDDDIPQSARASYIMEHRLDGDPTYPETYEVVVVSWSHMLGQSKVKAERSIVINLVKNLEYNQYSAQTFIEYTEMLDGAWKRVSPHGYDYDSVATPPIGSEEWDEKLLQGLADFEASEGTVSLGDVEKLHQVADYIRGGSPRDS